MRDPLSWANQQVKNDDFLVLWLGLLPYALAWAAVEIIRGEIEALRGRHDPFPG